MMCDKSMSLKLEYIIVISFLSYVKARRIVVALIANYLCLPVVAADSGRFGLADSAGNISIFLLAFGYCFCHARCLLCVVPLVLQFIPIPTPLVLVHFDCFFLIREVNSQIFYGLRF